MKQIKQIKTGIMGFGTVGTGVAKILLENKDIISSRLGAELVLKRIADIDTQKDRGLVLPESICFNNDANNIIDDPEIDIVIETIGGDTVAKNLILKAIDKGKQIVTANKALLAKHGNELLKAAHSKGVELAFEASIGGCMPVIKTIREVLISNNIKGMMGILNGTCNYILSNITSDPNISFEDALKDAQKKGFAEADPTLDIEGFDTAHKLSIFIALAYGMEFPHENFHVEGITRIKPIDIKFAQQFNYIIKLLAITKNHGNEIEARVHPAMIPKGHLLSRVTGSMNAINICGDCVGDMILYGYGAGMMPTASAIISDVVDLGRNILFDSKNRVPMWSYQIENVKKLPIKPITETINRYYIRFGAVDKPGVLAKISGVLGKFEISIESVRQEGHANTPDKTVPIVMITHRAKEQAIQDALSEIYSLDVVTEQPVFIRIENEAE